MGGRGRGLRSGIVLLRIGPLGIPELVMLLVILLVGAALAFLLVRLVRWAWRI